LVPAAATGQPDSQRQSGKPHACAPAQDQVRGTIRPTRCAAAARRCQRCSQQCHGQQRRRAGFRHGCRWARRTSSAYRSCRRSTRTPCESSPR
jgi:hypothetical protein